MRARRKNSVSLGHGAGPAALDEAHAEARPACRATRELVGHREADPLALRRRRAGWCRRRGTNRRVRWLVDRDLKAPVGDLRSTGRPVPPSLFDPRALFLGSVGQAKPPRVRERSARGSRTTVSTRTWSYVVVTADRSLLPITLGECYGASGQFGHSVPLSTARLRMRATGVRVRPRQEPLGEEFACVAEDLRPGPSPQADRHGHGSCTSRACSRDAKRSGPRGGTRAETPSRAGRPGRGCQAPSMAACRSASSGRSAPVPPPPATASSAGRGGGRRGMARST